VGDGQGTRYSVGAANRPVAHAGGGPLRPRLAPVAPEHMGGAEYGSEPGPGPLPGLVAGAAIVVALAAWTWRRLDRVEVSGLSMAPGLQPGDRLVVWRTRSVRPGDVVAVPDPRQPERTILKRVISVRPEGLFLLGDNPRQSTDSRQFGYVPLKSVLGKALYRYAPSGRTGRLS
jgi:nickel-type superoxide dismutase maturation protease